MMTTDDDGDDRYDPHGAVHIWIGGVVDCEQTYSVDIEELVGESTARDLAMLAFVHRKDMFRAGIFSCEGSVAVTEPPAEVSLAHRIKRPWEGERDGHRMV